MMGYPCWQSVENATNDVTDMLHRMRELAVQAVNDTNSLEDRQFLQRKSRRLSMRLIA
jgi:flagellin-like hook-associated protein FlgL